MSNSGVLPQQTLVEQNPEQTGLMNAPRLSTQSICTILVYRKKGLAANAKLRAVNEYSGARKIRGAWRNVKQGQSI